MIKLFLFGKEKCIHFLTIGEREDDILLFSREWKNSNKETNMGLAQAFFDPLRRSYFNTALNIVFFLKYIH